LLNILFAQQEKGTARPPDLYNFFGSTQVTLILAKFGQKSTEMIYESLLSILKVL